MTCVSNSNTQRQLIQNRAQTLGYQGRLECITADANVFTTAKRFDRIFSIEMFEVEYCFLLRKGQVYKSLSSFIVGKINCFSHHELCYLDRVSSSKTISISPDPTPSPSAHSSLNILDLFGCKTGFPFSRMATNNSNN